VGQVDSLGFVVSRNGNDHTFLLAGELDISTRSILLESFHLPSLAGRSLVLDLRDVTFIDSSGVQSLLMILDALGTGRLTLQNARPNVWKLFEMVGLTDFGNLDIST
jgi:stage II sporulation protein AA (anti-sigma F factor antagonist)